MAEYGYLIVRNPGPETELIYGGFTGGRDGFSSSKSVIAAIRGIEERGDRIHYLTLFGPDETENTGSQLAVDDNEVEFRKR